MRRDMSKVVVERGRIGGHNNRKGRPAKDPDALPEWEGMRRPHRDRKQFTDVLGPLERFLRKNVGRPWSKVHSEICERLDGNSVTQKHVLDHVMRDLVELHPQFRKDGTPLHRIGRLAYMFHPELEAQCYVDRKGFLRYAPKKRRKYKYEPKPDPDVSTITGQTYKRINGSWYLTWNDRVPWKDHTRNTWKEIDIERRRLLSKKELRGLGFNKNTSR